MNYGAPQYQNYAREAAPEKKKSNAGIIILLCIVGLVVIAGIVLASLSGIMNAALSGKATADEAFNNYTPNFDYIYPENKLDLSSQTINKIGEPVTLNDGGTLTLTKVEKTKDKMLSDENAAQYAVTVEFKNTTNHKLKAPDIMLNYFNADGENLIYDATNGVTFLYDDASANFYESISEGETAVMVEYISVNKNLDKMYLLMTDNVYRQNSIPPQGICYEIEVK